MWGEELLRYGLVPDCLVRLKIRSLLSKRLSELKNSDSVNFINQLKHSPIAVCVDAANEQHYEVPAEFFEKVLGSRLKYSCAYFEAEGESLDRAEVQMLNLYFDRGEFKDGQDILELGCGWGSLTLSLAQKYPRSNILGVSNSNSQREYILKKAKLLGVSNVEIQTCDMNVFSSDRKFDRVVSIEMFEHMRNIPLLFSRISTWLKKDSKLFIHIFSHSHSSYFFEQRDSSDWMSRYFFSGGMMPSHHLYSAFQEDLKIENEWRVSGLHYSRTAEHWLKNMDTHKEAILTIFKQTYGQSYKLWWVRWRIFFMACSELWKWNEGREWGVSHFLFRKVHS